MQTDKKCSKLFRVLRLCYSILLKRQFGSKGLQTNLNGILTRDIIYVKWNAKMFVFANLHFHLKFIDCISTIFKSLLRDFLQRNVEVSKDNLIFSFIKKGKLISHYYNFVVNASSPFSDQCQVGGSEFRVFRSDLLRTFKRKQNYRMGVLLSNENKKWGVSKPSKSL